MLDFMGKWENIGDLGDALIIHVRSNSLLQLFFFQHRMTHMRYQYSVLQVKTEPNGTFTRNKKQNADGIQQRQRALNTYTKSTFIHIYIHTHIQYMYIDVY